MSFVLLDIRQQKPSWNTLGQSFVNNIRENHLERMRPDIILCSAARLMFYLCKKREMLFLPFLRGRDREDAKKCLFSRGDLFIFIFHRQGAQSCLRALSPIWEIRRNIRRRRPPTLWKSCMKERPRLLSPEEAAHGRVCRW